MKSEIFGNVFSMIYDSQGQTLVQRFGVNFWLHVYIIVASIKFCIETTAAILQLNLLRDEKRCHTIYDSLHKEHKKHLDWE